MESVMKKVLPVIMGVFLLIMSGMPVLADMGMPEKPEYTVLISIYGADYYITYEDFTARNASGRLAGGQTFYVWNSRYEGGLYGTTDPNAGPDQYNDFVFILNNEGMTPTDMVTPDVGTKTDSTVTASTTDALNLRYGPGTGFKVIKTLDKDTEVTYDYTFNTDTTWMYVNAGGTSGWVSGDYLKTKSVAQKEPAAEENKDESVETPADEPEPEGSLQKMEESQGKNKKTLVAGLICICAGVAVLIAVLAAYLLKNRR